MRTCLPSTNYTSFSDLVISLNRTEGQRQWGHQNCAKLLTLWSPLIEECNQNINNPPELYCGCILLSTDSMCMCVHVCVHIYLCVEPCAEPLLHQCTGSLEESGWNGHVSLGRSKGSWCSSQKYRHSYTEDP